MAESHPATAGHLGMPVFATGAAAHRSRSVLRRITVRPDNSVHDRRHNALTSIEHRGA